MFPPGSILNDYERYHFPMSDSLAALGSAVGALLKERRQTIAVAESSAGGLINAALVAVPGASAYYLGSRP